MPIPSESVVRQILMERDRGKLIRRATAAAWEEFEQNYPQRAWWRRRGTRASVIWEHCVQNAISLLEGDAGCKPVPHDDTLSLVFDQQVLVRFKKADIELRSRNYPTPLATLFHTHEAVLPGFEDLHRVEAAYVLNQFQTKMDWIGIVARDQKKLLWQYELDGGGTVEHLPVREPTETAADRVMRPKATPEAPRKIESE